MFPTSTIKTAGNAFTTQNTQCGDFQGHIKEMRPIKSNSNPTCFGVLDIEVKGERKPFQFYLNYNPQKEESSVSYLVSKTKDLIIACGKQPDMEAERDMAWVENTLKALISEKAEFWFKQREGKRGLEIDFLDKAPTSKDW